MAAKADISALKDGLEEQGLEILEDVKLKSFTVTPQTIVPFEEAELSWEVVGPANARFFVELNRARVAKRGKATVRPLNTTTYELEATALAARKSVGKVTLVVDRQNCFADSIGQNTIEASIQAQLTDLIRPGAEVQLRGDPVAVTVDGGRIVISVFLKLVINNFFDADLDLTLTFGVGVSAAGQVRTPLVSVDADVKFHPVEHILSLGSAALVQGVAQAVVAAMTKSFLAPQLEEQLASNLQDAIETLCRGARGADARITSVRALNGLLQFECCGVGETATFSDVVLTGALQALQG